MKRIGLIGMVMVLFGVAGCGGGGGGSALKGTANIHGDSERPRVGIMSIDINDNLVTVSSAEIKQAPQDGGWHNMTFKVSLPPVSYSGYYDIIVFNDRNKNSLFDEDNDEFLGVYDHYLYYSSSASKWRILDEYDNVIYRDATSLGYNDVYIEAEYRRSRATSDIGSAIKKAKSGLIARRGR